LYKLPGVFIAINAEKPSGGMDGSTVPLIGLKVDHVAATVEKANSAGARVVQDGKRVIIIGPDEIRIELTSDVDTIHVNVPDIAAAEQWYAKTFGAALGKDHSATLPGAKLVFSTSTDAPAGTKGRALDHIGLEVRDLREFTKNLAATGQKVDLMYLKLPDSGVAIAFVTDPFGTFIELTDGLIRF
jgi:catechol 2,3-dioxygenase-like lactoylglutathione lyase family enzyme